MDSAYEITLNEKIMEEEVYEFKYLGSITCNYKVIDCEGRERRKVRKGTFEESITKKNI